MKIGIDWGGTKIEAVLINSSDGAEINRLRVDSPKDDYEAIIKGVVDRGNWNAWIFTPRNRTCSSI
jgi:predicted NBD/HSP70 family sugar kinase